MKETLCRYSTHFNLNESLKLYIKYFIFKYYL